MITYYTAIVFISSLSMVVMAAGAESNHLIPVLRKRFFQVLFLLLIVTNLTEWLADTLDGTSAAPALLILFKFIEFSVAPFIPIVCMFALGGLSRGHRWIAIPAALNVTLQLSSLVSSCVFFVTEANRYQHGPLYGLYIAIVVVEALLLMIHCLRYSRKYRYTNFWFLVLINLIVLLAVLETLLLPSIRLDWTCISFAAILFYCYYNQLVYQVDDLTGLLNRMSLDRAIEQMKKPAVVIFFDVDRFKQINDEYGHSFGDTCLVMVSQALREVFENHGYCYRYGGDEFCVIQHQDQTENTEALISQYIAQLKKLRETEPRTPCVSAGYATFDPAVEDIEDAMKRADEMMYLYKQIHRMQKL